MFVVNILILNLLFSYLGFLAIVKVGLDRIINKNKLFIYSLGLGPAVTAIVLYYIMLFLPGLQASVYIYIIITLGISAGWFLRSEFIENLVWIKFRIAEFKTHNGVLFFLSSVAITLFLAVWILTIVNIPIQRHDTFEYATQAKIIADEKQIEYKQFNLHEDTYFYFVSQHGLNFPILAVFENLINEIFGIESDFYFRSVTGYYWILTLLTYWTWVYRKDLVLSIFGLSALVLVPGFLGSFFFYHIDTFRLFFICTTATFIYYAFKNQLYRLDIITGVYLGLMMNAHALNVFIGLAWIFLFFIFKQDSLKNKFKHTLLLCLFAILFGGIHYVLDTFIGTGWIFVHLNYYFPRSAIQ
jgi:hypothetical protein